jgi:hypothetical protein
MGNLTIAYIYYKNFAEGLISDPNLILNAPVNDLYNSYLDFPVVPNQWYTKCSSAYDSEREYFKVTQMEAYNTFGNRRTEAL